MAIRLKGQAFRTEARFGVGWDGGAGSARIDGGDRVTVTTPLTAGPNGYFDGPTIIFGRLSGGVGTVTVNGAGSALDLRGGSPGGDIGSDGGAGTLRIEAGASFSAMGLNVGRNRAATPLDTTGTIIVTGAGSRLALSSDFGANPPAEPFYAVFLNIGRGFGGNGTLEVLNGASALLANSPGRTQQPWLSIGRDGGEGLVRLSGPGSRLDMIETGPRVTTEIPPGPTLLIGLAGQGRLIVENGAFARLSGNDSFVGLGTRFNNSPAGSPAEGTLIIRSGGQMELVAASTAVFSGALSIGHWYDSRGHLEVTGAGSLLRLLAPEGAPALESIFLRVGNRGDGTMTVSNGARVEIDGRQSRFPGVQVGRGDDDGVDATGNLLVTGRGSAIEIMGSATDEPGIGGFLNVGLRRGTTGEVTVAEGGAIRLTGTGSGAWIGSRDGATARMTVEGAGSVLDVVGGVRVGVGGGTLGGEARLTVQDGGRVRAGAGGEVEGTGTLDLAGRLEGRLAVLGTLAVGAGTLARGLVTGDLAFTDGAGLALDAAGFGQVAADRLTVLGAADFNLAAIQPDIRVADLSVFASGDTIVFADVRGTLTPQSRTVTLDGAQFRLEAADQELRLTALEDRGVSFAETLAAGESGGRFVLGAEGGRFEGGAGDEVVTALGTGGNRIALTAGSNRVMTGVGDDTVRGGTGDDVILAGRGGDNFIDMRAGGDNRIAGGNGADTILGGVGRDVIRPGRGNDYVDAGDGDNFIANLRGDSTLIGGAGDDRIFGGIGDTLIMAGGGSNRVVGGPGRDVIAFREEAHETRILDFRPRSDTLDFSHHDGVAALEDLSLRQIGGNVVIDDGTDGRIILAGIGLDQIGAGDFLF